MFMTVCGNTPLTVYFPYTQTELRLQQAIVQGEYGKLLSRHRLFLASMRLLVLIRSVADCWPLFTQNAQRKNLNGIHADLLIQEEWL